MFNINDRETRRGFAEFGRSAATGSRVEMNMSNGAITMASHIAYDSSSFDSTATIVVAPKKADVLAYVRSIFDRIRAREDARAESRIEAFINLHGGELTDDLERQISREFGRPAGWH